MYQAIEREVARMQKFKIMKTYSWYRESSPALNKHLFDDEKLVVLLLSKECMLIAKVHQRNKMKYLITVNYQQL